MGSCISASAKGRPARAMKASLLVIFLVVGVFGEEEEEISDALVEEGINQLTSEISEDELKTLGQSGTLDFSEAFRCGLFMTWPGKSDDKPVSPLFIFNATFPASEECAAGKPNYDRYKSFCSSAWDKGFENRGVTLESPSIDKKRAEQGERVVDDICGYMKKPEDSIRGKAQQEVPQWSRVWNVHKRLRRNWLDLDGEDSQRTSLLQEGQGSQMPKGHHLIVK